MRVRKYESQKEFDQLRSRWVQVYDADPEAHIFLSWAWLRGFIDITPFAWMVLAILPDDKDEIVGFVFLTLERKALNTVGVLRLGANPLADYTGFVCLPQCQEEALEAAAHYIANDLQWDIFYAWDALDCRLVSFTDRFDQKLFHVRTDAETPCPFIPLCDSYEAFEQTKLNRSTRKKLRRRTRQIAELSDYRLEALNDHNLQQQIDTLFSLWEQNWQRPADHGLRKIFERCHGNNHLWLNTIWDGTTPVCGLAAYVDLKKRTFYSFMSAYNQDYSRMSPGLVLDGYSIQNAIQLECKTYDYLRGAHEYKFRLGAEMRSIPRITLIRRRARSTIAVQISELLKTLRTH